MIFSNEKQTKKLVIFHFIFLIMILLTGCKNNNNVDQAKDTTLEENEVTMIEKITAKDAKSIMDTTSNYILIDVREEEEYDMGHIEGAILLPLGEIKQKAASILPDQSALILVYCRSGRRSAMAAQTLSSLGYTNIKDFGGILDWPYAIVK